MIECIAVQMCSGPEVFGNLKQLDSLLALLPAVPSTPRLIVLPENFAGMGMQNPTEIDQFSKQIIDTLKKTALLHQAWIVAGSIPLSKRPDGTIVPNQKLRSCSLLFNPQGEIAGRYDKVHLFDAEVADQTKSYQESRQYEAGTELTVVPTPFGNIGMMICYDLRFPELAIKLRQQGADILVVPAAFTVPTGRLNWSTLLAARALDTQCHVIAADQCGKRLDRETWGHSAIVDCQGQVLSLADQITPSLVKVTISLEKQKQFRKHLPIYSHRKLTL